MATKQGSKPIKKTQQESADEATLSLIETMKAINSANEKTAESIEKAKELKKNLADQTDEWYALGIGNHASIELQVS